MRVLVCGGRDFDDVAFVHEKLTELHNSHGHFQAVIHGDAKGVDSIAAEWAVLHGITELPNPANWDKYGARAGPIRNTKMLKMHRPDLVVVFPGGNGTKDMHRKATKAGYTVITVEYKQ